MSPDPRERPLLTGRPGGKTSLFERRKVMAAVGYAAYFAALFFGGKALQQWRPRQYSGWEDVKLLLGAGYVMVPFLGALAFRKAPIAALVVILIWVMTFGVIARLYAPMR